MYKNIQTPNSPLSPLAPRIRPSDYMVEKMSNLQYLTPSLPTKLLHQQHKRRSFTPSAFDNAAPPSVSPIPTVYESPEWDLNNSAILKKPVSSATKLVELMNAVMTPPNLTGLSERKSHSCTVHRRASSKVRRAYHCQRKIDNRPNMNINITTLRRSLYKSLQSPSMPEEKHPNATTWNDSPMLFGKPTKETVNGSASSKVKSSVPLINMFTPDKACIAPKIDGISYELNNDSILNNNLTVETILKEIGMDKYIEKFQLEEIDLFVFFNLDPADLHELNIDEADRGILLQAIKTYAI